MRGILQKTSIKKGHTSRVLVGYSEQGLLQRVIYTKEEPEAVETSSYTFRKFDEDN